MNTVIGLSVSLCVFAGGMAGMQLYRLLPDSHLSTSSREVVRLGTNMVAILAALVLGLLIASAKGTFDRADQQIRGYAADLTHLDQTLRQLGPAGEPARKHLLQYAERAARTIWPDQGQSTSEQLEDKAAGKLLDQVAQEIVVLTPVNDSQSWLRAQAMEISARLIHTRWTVLVSQRGTTSPISLVIVVIWITVIFASFGLAAPRNATVVTAFLVCALSIGTAVYLILEIETPFSGAITVSGEPMWNALAHIQSQP